MRNKISQFKTDSRYGFGSPLDSEEKKLDLNDLLKRASKEREKSKKMNVFIFSGTFLSVLLFFFLVSF
jgi:hypothetical protein|tara:strand:- start:802 stop:1005 length:204 start_codon:yes stop_codon:yes gene_type:complete